MGKKYIIESLDDCQSEFKGILVFGLTQDKQISLKPIPEEDLTPYTEPDLDAIRKWAYDKGYCDAAYNCHETCDFLDDEKKESYQRGLNDAWEAAKKIGSNSMCSLKEMGFDFGQCVVNDYNPSWFVVKNYSASECIEKIRQYEQEKEIQVGDEIKSVSGKAVVTGLSPDNEHVRYVYPDGSTGVIHKSSVSRTGRHYPEIAEVLWKMKEEST